MIGKRNIIKEKERSMAYKIFLDINVILDFTLERNSFEAIEIIFNKIENNFQKGYITSATIHTLSYLLSKQYGQKKTKELLLALMNTVSVIDPPQEVIINALHANFNDIEDAIQVYTALHYKMDYFITSDKKLIKESTEKLPILTPKEFNKILGQ